MKRLFIAILCVAIMALLFAALSGCSGPAFIDIVRKIANATSMEIELKVEYEQSSEFTEAMSMRLMAEQKGKKEFAYVETISLGNKSEVYIKNGLVYMYLNGDLLGISNPNSYDTNESEKLTNVMLLNFVGIDYEQKSEKRPKGRTAYIININEAQIEEVFGAPPGWLRYDSCVATLIAKNSKNLPETMKIAIELSNGSKIHYNITYKSINGKISKALPKDAEDLNPEEYGLEYELTNGNTSYQVSKYNGIYNKIVIPNTYKGLPVISINRLAFSDCNSLSSIVVPESVISIEDFAFTGCENLEQIDILGNSILSIGAGILNGTPLKRLNSEADGVFNLNDSITTIGYDAFRGLQSLVHLKLPSNLEIIPINMCNGCINLESVSMPNELKIIKEHAFNNCSSLRSINIPGKVTKINSMAFAYCTSLEAVIFEGENLTIFSAGIFLACINLTNIEIPNNITEIHVNAFGSCRIQNIYLSKFINYISEAALINCSNLSNVYVDPDNQYYKDIDGVLYNKSGTIILQYPIGKEATLYTVEEGVEEVAGWAFSYINNLERIVLPESLLIIDNYAFADTPNIRELIVYAPEPPIISSHAFNYNTQMKIYVPDEYLEVYLQNYSWMHHTYSLDDLPQE